MGTGRRRDMTFERLVTAVRRVHDELALRSSHAVNTCLTLRNWLIGCAIFEYEQGGSDRAAYGEQLLDRLADRLQTEGLE